MFVFCVVVLVVVCVDFVFVCCGVCVYCFCFEFAVCFAPVFAGAFAVFVLVCSLGPSACVSHCFSIVFNNCVCDHSCSSLVLTPAVVLLRFCFCACSPLRDQQWTRSGML